MLSDLGQASESLKQQTEKICLRLNVGWKLVTFPLREVKAHKNLKLSLSRSRKDGFRFLSSLFYFIRNSLDA